MDLRPGYKQTEAGIIPEDWRTHTIGNSLRLINGRAFKPDDWKDNGLPIVRIQNLNDTDASFNYWPGPVEDRHRIEAGDLLFAWSGTTGTSFGARVWNGPVAVLNQHIFKVIPDLHKLTRRYALLVLRQVQEHIEKQAHGFKASFVHVKKSDLVGVQLPLPPTKAEQEAIADALSDADALVEAQEQVLAKKRQIKQGAMQELLTGRKRLPGFSDEWHSKALRKITQIPVTDGPHLTPRFLNDGVPFLSVNNLVGNTVDLSTLRFVSKEDHAEFSKKCRPQKDDVLLGKAASVGRVALVDFDMEFNIWSPIALIRVNSDNVPRFVYYSLQTEAVIRQIELLTNSSSQGNIGMRDIERLVLFLPKKKEQQAIADVLSDIDGELATLETKLAKARNIKQGMMQELLTGRIRLI
jgi:type I restriction enzyme S subunit